MEDTTLPIFDATIQWKSRKNQPPRRKLNFPQTNTVLPSLRQNSNEKHGIRRQLSTTSSEGTFKKHRKTTGSSEEEMSGTEEPETPATGNITEEEL